MHLNKSHSDGLKDRYIKQWKHPSKHPTIQFSYPNKHFPYKRYKTDNKQASLKTCWFYLGHRIIPNDNKFADTDTWKLPYKADLWGEESEQVNMLGEKERWVGGKKPTLVKGVKLRYVWWGDGYIR